MTNAAFNKGYISTPHLIKREYEDSFVPFNEIPSFLKII